MNFKENMMEEQRNLKVSFNKSGGTAGKGGDDRGCRPEGGNLFTGHETASGNRRCPDEGPQGGYHG